MSDLMEEDFEKPCRLCEITAGLLFLVPLISFVTLALIKDDSDYWWFMAMIIGLPFALVASKILAMTDRSRRTGLLSPAVLYVIGTAMTIAPFFTHSNYAAVGVGMVVIAVAKKRQVERAKVKAEIGAWRT